MPRGIPAHPYFVFLHRNRLKRLPAKSYPFAAFIQVGKRLFEPVLILVIYAWEKLKYGKPPMSAVHKKHEA
jgi:hypothetical protein